MGGVQSVPRVMRSLPARRPNIFDVPINSRKALAGLESQGIARTLGSLGSLGSDASDRAEIEMAEECMRPGEILLSPGVCGPDPRSRVNPYAAAPGTSAIPISTTTTKASASLANTARGMSKTTMVIAAIGAIGLIYYLGKK
jgi:hypothetical protein